MSILQNNNLKKKTGDKTMKTLSVVAAVIQAVDNNGEKIRCKSDCTR